MRVVRVDSEGGFGVPDPGVFDPRDEELEPEPEYPLVLVTWQDAWFDFDQETAEDPRADYLVKTVGFLVSDGPRFVSIAQEVLPDGDGFRAVTHIPRSIIESIAPLQLAPDEVRANPTG